MSTFCFITNYLWFDSWWEQYISKYLFSVGRLWGHWVFGLGMWSSLLADVRLRLHNHASESFHCLKYAHKKPCKNRHYVHTKTVWFCDYLELNQPVALLIHIAKCCWQVWEWQNWMQHKPNSRLAANTNWWRARRLCFFMPTSVSLTHQSLSHQFTLFKASETSQLAYARSTVGR